MLASLPSTARYLEIGVSKGYTFESVRCGTRVGVEPAPKFDLRRLPPGVRVHAQPSDDYFAELPASETFDVAFVDGLHHFEQAYRDIVHTFQHLRLGGAVLVDDVVPVDAYSAMRDMAESLRARAAAGGEGNAWHGDVFRTVKLIADRHPELALRTIVGSGNEQALLWRVSSRPVEKVGADVVDTYRSLSYEELFRSGVPSFFRPGGEVDVIAEWRRERGSVRTVSANAQE
jgi:hypothetical protein